MNTKPRIFLALSVFFLFAILPYISLGQSKSEKVKSRLIELFELAKDDKYSEAAPYIVYRGPDEQRKWKDVYNYDNKIEREDVISICTRIKTYLEVGGAYKFSKFKTETESEGQWCIWEVSFYKVEDQRVYFAFLKIKGKYCLGDID